MRWHFRLSITTAATAAPAAPAAPAITTITYNIIINWIKHESLSM